MSAALVEFAIAATLLILAPGPDNMLVLRNSLRGGRQTGLWTAAGTVTGLLSWAVAAALGVSTLLAASRVGYDGLRLVGGAYLIWLGIVTLRRRNPGGATAGSDGNETVSPSNGRARRAYFNGLISNACNPKVGVFFVAFLPAMMPAGVSVRAFSLVLGAWFAAETALWLAALVWIAERAREWWQRPRWQWRLEQVTGVVLIGFGVRLATERR